MTAKRRGVLVGLGGHGKRWAGICRQHPAVEIVAYVGRSEQSRRRAATEWEIPAGRLYASLEHAIDAAAPDFVLDVTSPDSHREVALTSFAAGLPVLGEKPMSDDYLAAAEMAAAAERAGCIHMITQQQRFAPQPRLTRRLLADGVIGEPGQLDISFFVPWADKPGTHYVTESDMFLLDMGCHHFDTMRYVLGAEPEAVRVISWNPSWGWHAGDASHVAVFEFPGGLMAIHRAMGCSNGAQTPWSGNWRLEGPRGSVTWEDDRVFVTREHRTPRRRREQIPCPAAAPQAGPAAALDEFLEALEEGRAPECSSRDNLKTMAMTYAAVRSAQQGRRVSLSELGATPRRSGVE